MSSLFSNLPEESGRKRPEAPAEAIPPAAKKLRPAPVTVGELQVTKPASTGQDPVLLALVKITTHISSSKKFNKASELLRQLISEDKIGSEHSRLVFEVTSCINLCQLSNAQISASCL